MTGRLVVCPLAGGCRVKCVEDGSRCAPHEPTAICGLTQCSADGRPEGDTVCVPVAPLAFKSFSAMSPDESEELKRRYYDAMGVVDELAATGTAQ